MWLVKCCWFYLVLLQSIDVYAFEDECLNKQSCRECISTPNCMWCSEAVKQGSNDVHCMKNSSADLCPEDKRFDYETKYEPILEGDDGSRQLYPQKSKLQLRLGEETKIKMKFIKAKDYPVDLYYLMDLSKSMEDDKMKISALGKNITDAMRGLTKNFRLGFGSFVDKQALPFVSTVPAKLKQPCPGCAPPYSFKNHMPLDNRTELFQSKVRDAPVSGNIDSPEGGFDALMQVMACGNEIQWRLGARRLIVFSTDATFHIAGDGRLAGIVEPNDGECHMKEDQYTADLLYDYPSIAQLDNKARDNNFNIIFAIDKNQEEIYKRLSERIRGSAVGVLTASSENVVSLVKEQSEKLTQTVTMTANTSKEVEITFSSKCKNTTDEFKVSDTCDNVKQEAEISFEARIKVIDCPVGSGAVWNHTIQFRPLGINETFEVELQVYCGCDCENSKEPNSEACKDRGTLTCGICECNKGFTGQTCECSEKSSPTDSSDKNSGFCKITNSSEICSGRGSCRCGVCTCFERSDKEQVVSGKYCECDNFSCGRHDGKLCNGPASGRCKCGKCQCLQNWRGDSCNIYDNPKNCMDPASGKICADHGECKNGKCICDERQFTGTYCEKCAFCPESHCKELGDCVECLVYKTGKLADTCNQNCSLTITDQVDKFPADKDQEGKQDKDKDHLCELPDSSNCVITFKYYKDPYGKINITALREKDCPGAENVFAVVFGVIGATILIGLLFILIWKLLTTIHDRREYAKFEKERAQSRFDRGENPLYKGAVTKFDNPTFNSN